MKHRPRAVWLLESTDPTGATVMALRRIEVLRSRLASTPLTVLRSATPVPESSPLHGVLSSTALSGEVRIARADVVVTTGERTLASAAPRVRRGARLIHFVHTDPNVALASEPIIRTLPKVSKVVVPAHVDTRGFARDAGLRPEQVVALDDFTLPARTYLGSAAPKVVLAPGRLTPGAGILALAEAFRMALPRLAGWQLRIAGWGAMRGALEQFVAEHGLSSRIQLLGARHDLAVDYTDAGVVVRVGGPEGCGLPVLEALTAGIPVLGSADVPAVPRFLRNDVNGMVLQRTDPQSIAEALVAISDPARRADLARGARDNPAGQLAPDGRRAELALFDRTVK